MDIPLRKSDVVSSNDHCWTAECSKQASRATVESVLGSLRYLAIMTIIAAAVVPSQRSRDICALPSVVVISRRHELLARHGIVRLAGFESQLSHTSDPGNGFAGDRSNELLKVE